MFATVVLVGIFGSSHATPCAALADSVVAALPSDRTVVAARGRRLLLTCHDDFADLFRVGRAINRAAAFEQVRADLPLREAAGQLLDRAVQLQPRNAAAWFEFGIALKKRGGLQVDAYRAIGKALDLADQYPESTPPTLLADIQFERARHLQDWVDRFRWLRDFSRIPVATPSCSNLGLFCENYTRPADFNAQVRAAPLVSVDESANRERMIGLYAEVLRLDPTNVEAAERLGRELALGDQWEELEQLALAEVERQPDARFFSAVRAMAVERQGHAQLADSLFAAAIPELPDSMRRLYTTAPTGLDTIADVWRRSRPLWLAPYNDLQLEYWTRVTYALLAFTDREARVVGPETPEGDALVRYGFPELMTQMNRGQGQLLSANQMAAIISAALDCKVGDEGARPSNVGSPQCGETDVPAGGDAGGGSWLIWTYEQDRPSLVFEQRPGMRVPRYVFDGAAENYAQQLRKASPLAFTSKLAPHRFAVPVQVARFRGEVAGATSVALFGIVPAEQMGLPPNDSLATGLFIFQDTSGFPAAAQHADRFVPGPSLALTYRVPLPAGRYSYSLEAFAPTLGAAAVARGAIVAPVWNPDSLQMSDLLVAHQVTGPEGGALTWRDLLIEPSRTLTVAPGASLWLVWETYGLHADASGLGRYHVRLAVQDATAKSLPVRLLARLGVGPKPGAAAVALEWDAQRPLAPDGRALDDVSVQLPAPAAGAYDLIVTISDSAGRVTRATRRITIIPTSR